jgi:putative chitinase
MQNKDRAFTAIKDITSANGLTQIQVDSINAILDSCANHKITDTRQISYILATAYHESRCKPIEEVGKGHGLKYGIPDPKTGKVYYGRGFVQLTWRFNYITFGNLLKVDLYHHPELALDIHNAAEILVIGMVNGMFTGKRLSDYFTAKTSDPTNARRIINGTDRATLIAGYYNHIHEVIA